MAIQIKSALRKNPQDKAAAAKYYPTVVLSQEMTQKQIVEQIVLDALMTVIKRSLANGSPVRLGDLGSFRPSVSGRGIEDASKFGANTVKKARVIYVPSAEIKEAVKLYSFSKAGVSTASEDGGDEKPNPKPDEGGEAPDPAA